MRDLREKYRQASLESIADLKKTHNVICAVISGSYYADSLTPKSDADLFVIVGDCKYREKGVIFKRNIKVSYFLNPLSQINKLLEAEKNLFKRPTCEMLVFSQPLFGEKLAESLKKKALKSLANKTKKLSKDERTYFGWRLFDKLSSIEKGGDLSQSNYLQNDLFENCIDIFFILNRSYKPNAKYVIEKIRDINGDYFQLVYRYLTEKGSKKRKTALSKMTWYLLQELNFSKPVYFHRSKL